MSFVYELRQVANQIDAVAAAETERLNVRGLYNLDFSPEADKAVAESRRRVAEENERLVGLIMAKPDVFQRVLRAVADEREAKVDSIA